MSRPSRRKAERAASISRDIIAEMDRTRATQDEARQALREREERVSAFIRNAAREMELRIFAMDSPRDFVGLDALAWFNQHDPRIPIECQNEEPA